MFSCYSTIHSKIPTVVLWNPRRGCSISFYSYRLMHAFPSVGVQYVILSQSRFPNWTSLFSWLSWSMGSLPFDRLYLFHVTERLVSKKPQMPPVDPLSDWHERGSDKAGLKHHTHMRTAPVITVFMFFCFPWIVESRLQSEWSMIHALHIIGELKRKTSYFREKRYLSQPKLAHVYIRHFWPNTKIQC